MLYLVSCEIIEAVQNLERYRSIGWSIVGETRW